MTNKLTCADNYVIEEKPGVLQYCPYADNADWVREGLQAIAELRNTTTVLIKKACAHHKPAEAVDRWKQVHHHTFGDTIGDVISDFMEKNDKIIQFPKKS